jgi:hypothetical protein
VRWLRVFLAACWARAGSLAVQRLMARLSIVREEGTKQNLLKHVARLRVDKILSNALPVFVLGLMGRPTCQRNSGAKKANWDNAKQLCQGGNRSDFANTSGCA